MGGRREQTLPSDLASALARAVAHGQAVRRDDPRFSRRSDGFIEEQVVGLPAVPSAPDPFGWALVGEVHDHVADERREVWWQVATDRVRTRAVPWVGALVAEPVDNGPAYYDGTRMTWVDRSTGRELGPDKPG